MIWFIIPIFPIFAVWAVCRTIEVSSPDYQRAKRERAQADREYEASVRFRAQQEARTPEQVAADKELDEARCDADTVMWHACQYEGATDEDGVPWWEVYAISRERLTRAIERRKAAFAPMKESVK